MNEVRTDEPIGGSSYIGLRRGEMLLIFAFWTFMAVLSALGAATDPRGRMFQPGPTTERMILPFVQYYLWAIVTPIVFRAVSLAGRDRSRLVTRGLLLLAAGVILAMTMEALFAWLRFNVFPPPVPPGLRQLPPPGLFTGIGRGWFLDDLAMYLAVLGAGVARETSLRLRRRHEDAVRYQAEAALLGAQLSDARVAALRAQLNPHFLFNTLNAVSSLVERDPKGVRRMIARLSELLRHTLEGADAPELTLRQEIALVQRYLEIAEIRFQGQLGVEIRVPDELMNAMVPNLILQPLVENAVKYGVGESTRSGTVAIEAEREGEILVVRVLDDGPGLGDGTPAPGGTGVGLANTRQRLAALYGPHQQLELRERSEGGAAVEFRIPFHTSGDLRAAAE